MDTLEARWARLEPHAAIHGPDDAQTRPVVLLFHGCGGVQGHLDDYAAEATRAGWRSVIVDSFAPRGWSRAYGLTFVCSGTRFWGFERAGDVLATIHGMSRRDDVDPTRVVLAGWSHGGWAIMDLMTMALESEAEARIGGAGPGLLDGVKGAFFSYPYVNFGTRGAKRDWRYRPKVMGVIARRDHLGAPKLHEAVYTRARAAGCEVETVTLEGTHAFDQPGEALISLSPMQRDEGLFRENVARFGGFLGSLHGPSPLGGEGGPAGVG
ncbi:MAG: prolyl oligopeptidase family serine peptidase [Caulobacter sp.]|nr:prolyl oligopeptidase family serine peptidase [Caulobacter sp.]